MFPRKVEVADGRDGALCGARIAIRMARVKRVVRGKVFLWMRSRWKKQ